MKRCAHCACEVRPACQWRQATPETREGWKREGLGRMQGRGLCGPCYRKHRHDYDRHNQPTDVVLEEWRYLADPMVPVRSEVRRLAPRLGMKEKTLEKIVSMNIGSRFESGWGERIKRAS